MKKEKEKIYTPSVNALREHKYLPREIYHTEADYNASKKRIDEKRIAYDKLRIPKKVNGEL